MDSIAYFAESAFTGVAIVEVINDTVDYVVVYHQNADGTRSRNSKCKIYYTDDDRDYFVSQGKRYYIDDFLKN